MVGVWLIKTALFVTWLAGNLVRTREMMEVRERRRLGRSRATRQLEDRSQDQDGE